MQLLQNPFYILGASLEDSRQKIVELAEEKSLERDSDECITARGILTNPKKRLDAEVSWLPGLNAQQVARYIGSLKACNEESFSEFQTVTEKLAKVNLLTEALSTFQGYDILLIANPGKLVKLMVGTISEIATAFDEVDSKGLQIQLNRARSEANISEIREPELLEEALAQRRRDIQTILKDVLDKQSSQNIVSVLTDVTTSTTNNSTRLAPTLVEDLLDIYEINLQTFLKAEKDNLEKACELVKECLWQEKEKHLQEKILQVQNVLFNLKYVTIPLQLKALSRGQSYEAVEKIFWDVRNFAINVNNNYKKPEVSLQLTNMLKKAATSSPELMENLVEDTKILNQIISGT